MYHGLLCRLNFISYLPLNWFCRSILFVSWGTNLWLEHSFGLNKKKKKNCRTPMNVSIKRLLKKLHRTIWRQEKVGLKNSNLPVSSMSLASCRNPGKWQSSFIFSNCPGRSSTFKKTTMYHEYQKLLRLLKDTNRVNTKVELAGSFGTNLQLF